VFVSQTYTETSVSNFVRMICHFYHTSSGGYFFRTWRSIQLYLHFNAITFAVSHHFCGVIHLSLLPGIHSLMLSSLTAVMIQILNCWYGYNRSYSISPI